jgi:hypothetical protein
MRRALLFCGGAVLGLAAGAILWNAPELYLFTDSWHSAALTRMVGLGIVVEGVLTAFGAALCLGRAAVPLTPAPTRGGKTASGPASAGQRAGPVLPIRGLLFLLAAPGLFGQARRDSELLAVEEGLPAGARYSDEIVEADRRHERTERAFGVVWLVVGGALLATPLFLKPRFWQLGWRMNGVGCGIAAGGLLLSGLGAFVCYANGLAMEGASKDLSIAGYLGLLAGAIMAVIGSIIAAAGRSTA